ncbi:MAG: response regulator [Lachnospiraceae bacterium]|nr:response regulator [Lachnospiraceae bacterium]
MRNRILVADDMELNRELLQEMLEEEYDIVQAEDGKQAVECLEKMHEEIILVLLDLVMPELDGFAVLDVMNERGWMKKIPVIVISGETSSEAEKKCFEYGVSDFIQKPFNSSIVQKRVKNIVTLFSYQASLEQKVEQQTQELQKQNQVLQQQAEKLRENNVRIIDILGTVVESRNLESGEHIQRVKGFTRILGYQMMKDYPEYGLTEEKVEMITEASSLHDVGKIAIPDSILLKPGRLTDDEFDYMKSHTTRGCDILNQIEGIWEDDYRQLSYEICRHHHERYDGRGYPDKLSGDEIPISAQLVSVADVYDALVSERVYKDAFSLDEAFHMIIAGECGVFSPKLMESFRNARKEFEGLANRRKGK